MENYCFKSNTNHYKWKRLDLTVTSFELNIYTKQDVFVKH